ncbi:hypothetical protein NKG05_21025 [Oerskovia sp. M15]
MGEGIARPSQSSETVKNGAASWPPQSFEKSTAAVAIATEAAATYHFSAIRSRSIQTRAPPRK